jgi:DNA replication ATP-dependent helicase Dna2
MLLQDLYRLIQDEKEEAQRRLYEVWERPLQLKLLSGHTQGFTRIEAGPESDTIWAYPDEGESRFREGDLLCLHSGHPIDKNLGRRLSFEQEDSDRWLLRDKMAKAVLAEWDGGHCYADQDTLDLSGYHNTTLRDIGSTPIGRDVILPLLEGKLDIEFDEADFEDGATTARQQGFNARQAEAVGFAFGARQMACIQGPPGTGKTRVLGLIARMMARRGERILLTSHTHTAINNALNKVHAEGVPTVKIGRRTQTRGLDDGIPHFENLAGWEERPQEGYVVGATPFATCNPRLEQYEFDTIIFDEASQVTVSLALMAMRKGRRYIFIGDQKQLPPVLLSRSILQKAGYSIFSRLTAQDATHSVMLEQTFRMNRWLTEWPSKTYYGGRLESFGHNRERRFSLPFRDTAAPSDLQSVFSGEDDAIFMPTKDRAARTVNRSDVGIVVEICRAAIEGGLPPQEIGIVTPYRAQGRAIRQALANALGFDMARPIVADTVERMQGQEREFIILSMATGDPVFLQSVAEFFFQPERLNVSVTRAKTRLIIIGPDADVLAGLDERIPGLKDYRSLLKACKRVDI